MRWAAGDSNVIEATPLTVAEDFSFFQEKIPGVYIGLGVNKPNIDPKNAAPNHSPYFDVNEDALIVGVRALAAMAIDFINK